MKLFQVKSWFINSFHVLCQHQVQEVFGQFTPLGLNISSEQLKLDKNDIWTRGLNLSLQAQLEI